MVRASHSTLPSLMFKKSAPSSALATEDTMSCSMPHETNMFPFIWMFSPFLGTSPKNKNLRACSLLVVMRGMMHQNECLLSYMTREIQPLRLDAYRGNPRAISFLPLFSWCCLISPLQWRHMPVVWYRKLLCLSTGILTWLAG